MMRTIEVPDHLADAVQSMITKLSEKGADYSVADDAWDSNFRDTAEHFGIHPWESADFNELQKLSRLKALRRRGRPPINEPVVDSYLDKANFALLAYALLLHHNVIAHPSPLEGAAHLSDIEAAERLGLRTP